MAMFDDPGKRLRQLEKELKAAQPQEETLLEGENFYDPAAGEGEAYYEEDYRRDWKTRRREKRKARSTGGFGFLVTLELLAIAALIGWWIVWILEK